MSIPGHVLLSCGVDHLFGLLLCPALHSLSCTCMRTGACANAKGKHTRMHACEYIAHVHSCMDAPFSETSMRSLMSKCHTCVRACMHACMHVYACMHSGLHACVHAHRLTGMRAFGETSMSIATLVISIVFSCSTNSSGRQLGDWELNL